MIEQKRIEAPTASTPQSNSNDGKDSDFRRYSQELLFSFFTSVTSTKPSRQVTLYKVWRLMRSGKLAGVVKDDSSLVQYQNQGERNEPNPTLLMSADFDHVRDVEALKQLLLDSPTPPIMLHVTASGQGVRAVFALTEDVRDSYDHRARGKALNQYLLYIGTEGLDDDVTPDVKRMWYINHDPEAMLNEDFRRIDGSFMARWGNGTSEHQNAEKRASTDEEDAELGHFATICEIEKIRKSLKKPYEAGRSNYTKDLYFLCGKAGTDRGVLDDYVEANLTSHGFPMGEILDTCAKRYEVGRNERAKELAEQAKAEQERRDRLNRANFRIRSTDTIKPPTPVLRTPDAKIGVSEGNIMTVTGAAKSKKTFYLQMVVAEYIAEQGDLRPAEVVWFDTEQSASHAQRITHRIKALGDGELDEEGFQLYMLRELMPLDRAEVVEQTCRELKPRLVIIDGVVDICASFLDLEKSTETVQLLMTLSGELQCAIVGVIHENKADRNARGHLGTILMQKSETVARLTVREKFADYVDVDFPFTRNEPPRSFTFMIDEGLPWISTHTMPEIPKGYELWEKCLTAPMQWADLRDAYARIKGIQPKTAEAHIKRATDAGLIAKGDGDMYTLIELQPSINPLQRSINPLDNEL